MTKLFTDEEQLKIALMNVERYKDFNEYEKHNKINKAEFNENLKDCRTINITFGTYDKANDKANYFELNDKHILDAIFEELDVRDFYNLGDDESWYIESKEYTNADWIRDFTEFYDVFIIKDRIFVNEYY